MARRPRQVPLPVRYANQNTGKGEWLLYALLLFAGSALLILGWQTQAGGWDTNHPYWVGLLDGLTGFCFGVPVAGVLIRQVARRTTEAAERDGTIRAVVSQLEYLRGRVERPSQGIPLLPVHDSESLPTTTRLRNLATFAQAAAATKSTTGVITEETTNGLRITFTLKTDITTELRGAAANYWLWTELSFISGRLVSDVSRLAAVLFSSAVGPGLPDWFYYLFRAAQGVALLPPPAQHRWLQAAMEEPPRSEVMATISADRNEDRALAQAMRTIDDEVGDLARRLEALSSLISAGETVVSQLARKSQSW